MAEASPPPPPPTNPDAIIQEELVHLMAESTAKAKRLEEFRARRKSKDPMAMLTPTERAAFTAGISKAALVKPKSSARPSQIFSRGPKTVSSTMSLAKLLVAASLAAKVTLPPTVLSDLPSSGLVQEFEATVGNKMS